MHCFKTKQTNKGTTYRRPAVPRVRAWNPILFPFPQCPKAFVQFLPVAESNGEFVPTVFQCREERPVESRRIPPHDAPLPFKIQAENKSLSFRIDTAARVDEPKSRHPTNLHVDQRIAFQVLLKEIENLFHGQIFDVEGRGFLVRRLGTRQV